MKVTAMLGTEPESLALPAPSAVVDSQADPDVPSDEGAPDDA